jgi:NAD(P)-dependent dehydrogenase (short-subunit alcohol dehydrogenase family)
MNKFADAIVLITGAASGIGAATARRLAEEGSARLILADLNRDKLSELASSLDCATSSIVGDVSDEALWRSADLTGLTHAVANAGIGAGGPIAELTLSDWRRVMSVNLDGVFLTLRAAMTAMSGRGGAIVLTASVAGVKAEPGIAAYAASKAAVIQLARVAAKEGAPQHIRVNSIAPGGVETPIWAGIPMFDQLVQTFGSEQAAFREMGKAATPLRRFGKAEEIAAQIAFLLSDEAAFVTGSCFVSDGGYSL